MNVIPRRPLVSVPKRFGSESSASRRVNPILENVIVTGAEIIGLVLSVGLLVYLTVALLKPELFG